MQPRMICCFQAIRFTHRLTTDTSRSHQKSLKELASRKLAPDLESKVIGPPDSRYKSKGTPQLTIHQSRHLNLSKLGPPKTNVKFKDGEKVEQQRKSNQLEQNKPKPATNSTTTSTTSNTYSAPPFGLLNCLSLRRRKISNHPETGSTTTARPFADLKDVVD